jgi:hypothetical protein
VAGLELRSERRRVRTPRTNKAAAQLAREISWLRGETPPSILYPQGQGPSQCLKDAARRVAKVLQSDELSTFLALLGDHNADKPAPLLVSPMLFYAVVALKERESAQLKMPVLRGSPAEVREYLRSTAEKCTILAKQLQRGPRQYVVLGARSPNWKGISIFGYLPIIQAAERRRTVDTLDALLNRTATQLLRLAGSVSRPSWNRQQRTGVRSSAQQGLRSHVVRLLVQCLRKRLGQPYHSHVAMIATLLSGVETDSDYVKKIDVRSSRARGTGDKTA